MKTAILAAVLFAVPAPQEEIRLLVRSDDMGAAHGINEGCFRSVKEGIARSIEVIVPGPWFLEAARMLKELPNVDVGIHLCLTSEWEKVKWRPLTAAPSLVDKDGYFYPMVRQRKDFPPGTALLDAPPKLDEVEREIRAQIEAGKKHLPNLTHVSAHMGAATATPEMRALVQKLAAEHGLSTESKGAKGLRLPKGDREAALVEAIRGLTPGTWIWVEHPAADSPEMRSLGHVGYENVAADREDVLRGMTSEKVKAAVREKGVKLISYADLK